MSKTALIIGAGPAGLSAAYEMLKETDIIPIVLEESNEIGGISKTAVYKENRMDIGGHRFFSKDEKVKKMWAELMPIQGAPAADDKILGREKPLSIDGPDPEKTDEVMLVRNRVSRIFFLRKFFDYPVSMKPQTFINMGFVRTMKSGIGYVWSCIFKRKEKTLEDFMVNRFGTTLYGMFFEFYTEKLWGRHPRDIDPSWGAQRIKGLSLRKAITSTLMKPFRKKNGKVETSLIEEFIYPKKGPGQLWEKCASEVQKMGGQVRKNCKVTGIHLGENGEVNALTVLCDGKEEKLTADYYISSMPIKDLFDGMTGNVPSEVKKIATALPYRDFITVGLLVNKLRIKNETKMKTMNNIVPDCWIYVQERDVKIGRIQIFNNWSPYLLKDFKDKVWIGLEYFANEGDEFWNMTDQEFINFAIDELVKIDIIDKSDVLDSTRINVKKAYPAYFDSYHQIDQVKTFLNTIPNLFCIGRNGQHRYNNMDHSMVTAFETVKNIKLGITSKDNIWNVNTEEDYHEQAETSGSSFEQIKEKMEQVDRTIDELEVQIKELK